MAENSQFPHKNLGSQLKKRREMIHESLAEVSGAVEIDIEMLSKIEQGLSLPSEDILLLLISHLGVSEDDAVKLWELAGYEKQKSNEDEAPANDALAKQMFMVIPFDNRIMYSDSVQVTVNKYGTVLNFMQSGNGQQNTISRIGMSKDHAYKVLEVLKATLEHSNQPPRMLPKPKTTTEDKASN